MVMAAQGADLSRDAALLRGDAIGEAVLARVGGDDQRAKARDAEEDAALAAIDAAAGLSDDEGAPEQAPQALSPPAVPPAPAVFPSLAQQAPPAAAPEAPGAPFSAPAAPTAPAPATLPPAQQPPGEAPAPDQPGAVDMLARARTALQRDGVPESAYQNLPPDQLMQWGLAAFERQSKADDNFRRLNERLNGLESPKDQEPGPAEAPATPEQVTLEGVFEPLVELFGDEAGEGLKKLIGRVEERQKAELAQRDQIITQGRQAIEALTQGMTQMQVDAARQGLAQQMPQLRDDQVWNQVIETAKGLPRDQYRDWSHLLTSAVDVAFGAQARQALAQQQAAEVAAANAGQPSAVTGGRSPRPTPTPAPASRNYGDVESDILEAIGQYGADSPQVRQLSDELMTAERRALGWDEPLHFKR